EVNIDRPGTDHITARHGNAGDPAPCEQRCQHPKGCSQRLHQTVTRFRGAQLRDLNLKHPKLRSTDLGSELLNELHEQLDVVEGWYVSEHTPFAGEERGNQEWKNCVLRPANRRLTTQRTATKDLDNIVHETSGIA